MAAPAATVLDALQAQNAQLPRALSVHPAIADTSALISDVKASVEHGQASPLLIAMQVGVVRLMIAHTVWAEVPRNLARLGAAGRLDHRQAESLWWREYVPLIRVVDAGSLPRSEHETTLGGRDASDLPTARLHGLVAPAVVFASDRDLVDLGLSIEQWRRTARAAGELTEVGKAAFAGNFALNLGVAGAVGSARLVARLLRHPAAAPVVVGLAAGLIFTRGRWRPKLDEEARRLGDQAAAAWPTIEGHIVEFQRHLASVYDRWDTAKTGEEGSTALHSVARLLATSQPMTRREIVERLYPDATESHLRRASSGLADALHECSAFAEIRRGRWQVGIAGADLGGLADAPETASPAEGPPS